MKKKSRSPLLSGQMDWIALEILILFVITVVYTVIIWQNEHTDAQTVLETVRITVKEVAPFSYIALVYIVGAFELGGEIVLRYTRKIEQAVAEGLEQGLEQGIEQGIEQGLEQGLEQGIEQGKAEVYRAWHADWEKRKQAAEEKGIPFDEPPPKPE